MFGPLEQQKCPFSIHPTTVCSCKCPLTLQYTNLFSWATTRRETIMFGAFMNDRQFSSVLSAALGTPGEMLFQALYCTQSLHRFAMRGENACLPGSQRASLIAIPMVMAKDERDQQLSAPIPKAITFNRKTHLLLLTFALFCFNIRTASRDEDGISLDGRLWICYYHLAFLIEMWIKINKTEIEKVKMVNLSVHL